MTFLHQFSLLWLLAWGALAFFGLSVCWLIISSLWQLSQKKLAFSAKKSILSKPGEPEPYAMPAEKQTLTQIGKAMMLAAVILGAYDLGTKISYSHEYAAWKQRAAQYDKDHAAFQEAVAKWKAKQKEDR